MNIKEAVAVKLSQSSALVAETVIAQLAQETVDKRVQQITQAYTELDKLQKDYFRLKADIISFNEDGSVKEQAFSKERLEERKKSLERQEKIQKAIDKALDKDDWSDIGGVTQTK